MLDLLCNIKKSSDRAKELRLQIEVLREELQQEEEKIAGYVNLCIPEDKRKFLGNTT